VGEFVTATESLESRRAFLLAVLALALAPLLGCDPRRRRVSAPEAAEPGAAAPPVAAAARGDAVAPLDKPASEWRRLLEPQRYAVLFEEATERPFTSPLLAEKRAGTYLCAACRLPLFESSAKFESGTGWPSFTDPIPGRVGTKVDRQLFVARTEYHCIRCGGHQGHVFDDGPPPTGRRWCNNGLALEFVPAGEPLPELRS
jgi:peptide-methionine (R)-S-oxide reductase